MSRVRRCDTGELAPPERLDNGWLRVEGKIARVGIQEYEDAKGIHRELRIPEEVFSPESLRTFHLVPVTNAHPPVLLDAENTRSYQVGHAGEGLRREGDFIVAPLLLTDSAAIIAAKAGRSQLSNGYTCELDATQDPLLVEKWGPYDFIQRNIRGNHIALVDAARAGAEARIRLDSGAARMVDHAGQRAPAPPTLERTDMKTIRIDGVTIDLDAADAQAVIERTLQARKDKADAEILSASKRADSAEKRVSTVKDNALRLVEKVAGLREVWDAMKARMVSCDECGGQGKIASDADGSKMEKCGYCDGSGSVRMHDAVKGMEPAGEPDGDEPGEEDLDAALEDAGALDGDELEAEQATEEKAGAASKKDAAEKRRREKARKDAAEERESERKRLLDSRDRQVRRAMKSRIDLEMNARRYLDEADVTNEELRKLDDVGVMKAIVKKLAPDAKLDGKTAEQVRARYDAQLEMAPAFTVDQAREMASSRLPNLGPAPKLDAPKDARAAMIKRKDEAAKRKPAAAK